MTEGNGVDFSGYDAFLEEAAKDTRVGKVKAMVATVTDDTWPSGDARRKVLFNLVDVGGKADATFSALPTPEEIATQKATWDAGKKKAIASAITLRKQLASHYATTPEGMKEGDEFMVQTIKTKVDAEGKGGFIRVVAFLAKTQEPDLHADGTVADKPGF